MLNEKIPNYLSLVVDSIDYEPERQLALLEKIEEDVNNLSSYNFKDYYEKYIFAIKEIQLDDLNIQLPIEKEKRKRSSKEKESSNCINDEEEKTPKLKKKQKIAKKDEEKKEILAKIELEPTQNSINIDIKCKLFYSLIFIILDKKICNSSFKFRRRC